MATPHNSARRFGEEFYITNLLRKCRNTLCISNFSQRICGGKGPPKPADAIVRYCHMYYFFPGNISVDIIYILTPATCGHSSRRIKIEPCFAAGISEILPSSCHRSSGPEIIPVGTYLSPSNSHSAISSKIICFSIIRDPPGVHPAVGVKVIPIPINIRPSIGRVTTIAISIPPLPVA